MARTYYPKKKNLVPVDSDKSAFEDISLDEAIKGLKKTGFKNVKIKDLEVKEFEELNISENLMEDFSKINLETELVDLSSVVLLKRKGCKSKKEMFTQATASIVEILDTDVMELINMDVTTPLQEALDNIISMISLNQR